MESSQGLLGGIHVVAVVDQNSDPPRQALEMHNAFRNVIRVDSIFEPEVGDFVFRTLRTKFANAPVPGEALMEWAEETTRATLTTLEARWGGFNAVPARPEVQLDQPSLMQSMVHPDQPSSAQLMVQPDQSPPVQQTVQQVDSSSAQSTAQPILTPPASEQVTPQPVSAPGPNQQAGQQDPEAPLYAAVPNHALTENDWEYLCEIYLHYYYMDFCEREAGRKKPGGRFMDRLVRQVYDDPRVTVHGGRLRASAGQWRNQLYQRNLMGQKNARDVNHALAAFATGCFDRPDYRVNRRRKDDDHGPGAGGNGGTGGISA